MHCATSWVVPGLIPGGVTGFFSDIFLPTVPWPWGRLSLWWKWVPGHLLGVKAAGAWGWQPHHLHVLNVMKSGSLNLLETSGPYRPYYGAPLHLTYHCQNLGFTVFMCFDETYIRSLQTYIFISTSYLARLVRKANTLFDVREKMNWLAEKMRR
jgi:hypothetical protein